jgi:large conductance mechanosensitive channel
LLTEFKNFISRGNVLDLAVAFILGAAFTVIVKSLVSDILMPPIGLIFGDASLANEFVVLEDGATPGPYASLADAQAAGAVTLNYGAFIDAIIAFLIVALALFLIVYYFQKAQNLRKKEVAAAAPTTKKCPRCMSDVNINATRCAYCTSDIPAASAARA